MNRPTGRVLLVICVVAFGAGIYELGRANREDAPSPWIIGLIALAVCVIVFAQFLNWRVANSLYSRLDQSTEVLAEAVDQRLDVITVHAEGRLDEILNQVQGRVGVATRQRRPGPPWGGGNTPA